MNFKNSSLFRRSSLTKQRNCVEVLLKILKIFKTIHGLSDKNVLVNWWSTLLHNLYK